MRGDDRTVRGAIMVGASQGKTEPRREEEAWVVSSRIADLTDRFGNHETAVSDRFGAVEARLAAIEARLDLLLEGLDITVTPKK